MQTLIKLIGWERRQNLFIYTSHWLDLKLISFSTWERNHHSEKVGKSRKSQSPNFLFLPRLSFSINQSKFSRMYTIEWYSFLHRNYQTSSWRNLKRFLLIYLKFVLLTLWLFSMFLLGKIGKRKLEVNFLKSHWWKILFPTFWKLFFTLIKMRISVEVLIILIEMESGFYLFYRGS